jgi:Asp-tRNA(Asn)/Glu-tRNA(Gln) amidotransferase A subunit family amidase
VQAQKVRRLIKNDFARAFEQCDVIAGPTSPTVAFGLGEKQSNPIAMYLSDIYTIATNLAGLPGMSLPAGLKKICLLACNWWAITGAKRSYSMWHIVINRLPTGIAVCRRHLSEDDGNVLGSCHRSGSSRPAQYQVKNIFWL